MYKVKIAKNQPEAASAVTDFAENGFSKESIYVFSHNKEEEQQLTDVVGAAEVGIEEQGVVGAVENLLKSRGSELRAKLQDLGIPKADAENYEKQMDSGMIVIVAVNSPN